MHAKEWEPATEEDIFSIYRGGFMLKIEMMPKHYRMFIDYAIKTCDSVSLVFEKRGRTKM